METTQIYVIIENAWLPKLNYMYMYMKKYKITIVGNPQHTFLLLFDAELNNVIPAQK